VERLNAGEPFPNATLAESVQALHECAPGARDANSYTPPIDPVLLCLRQMFWALEALERGESGAAGNFVQNAREYVRLVRHRLRDSVSNETVT
jgi:hypothetical protein